MDKAEREKFNDDVVRKTAVKYGVSFEDLLFIGGFQNFIYQYYYNEKGYILRFTPHSHRSVDAVHAELEWVTYLSNHGVSVSKPVPSIYGNLLETIHAKESDSHFITSAFQMAPGSKIGYPECLDDTDLFEKCGRITGQLHTLAKYFVPGSSPRHHWYDNYYLRNISKYVPTSQHMVLQSCRELMNEIQHLPKNGDCYGIIHGDINVANFHLCNRELTLFDFDECQYSWFIEDIAIQLFYLVYIFLDDYPDDRRSQATLVMKHFLKGYTSVATIDQYWLEQIPLFLRLREIIVYVGMNRSWDLSNLDEWSKDYLTQSRVRIERGIPILDSEVFRQFTLGSH